MNNGNENAEPNIFYFDWGMSSGIEVPLSQVRDAEKQLIDFQFGYIASTFGAENGAVQECKVLKPYPSNTGNGEKIMYEDPHRYLIVSDGFSTLGVINMNQP